MPNKTKDCARCGTDFIFERSTAKYCSDSCRRFVNITAQRSEQRKKQKKAEERRTLRDLQKRHRDLLEHQDSFERRLCDLMCDEQEGHPFAAEWIERVKKDRDRMRPYWERDERMIRADAEKAGIKWERVENKPTKTKKKTTKPVSEMPANPQMSLKEYHAPREPMPKVERQPKYKVETKRKRAALNHGRQKLA